MLWRCTPTQVETRSQELRFWQKGVGGRWSENDILFPAGNVSYDVMNKHIVRSLNILL